MKENYEFYVAGVKHHELPNVDPELFDLEANVLTLEKEPTNKYDGTAVKILWQVPERDINYMLGYVPAKMSADVTYLIDSGKQVTCKVIEFSPFETPWKMLKVRITGDNGGREI